MKLAARVPVLPSVTVTSLIVMVGAGGGCGIQMPSLCATTTAPESDHTRSGKPLASKSASSTEVIPLSTGSCVKSASENDPVPSPSSTATTSNAGVSNSDRL